MRFEAALTEKLRIRSRKYEIFRDKGPDQERRIEPGKVWRDVVRDNLAAARCCIVAMVPTIFESKECAEEIAAFQRLVEADPRRFFFPIDFTEVQGRIAQLVQTGDEVARLMNDLDRHDFIAAVHEPNELLYKDKVDDIAKRIDRRFEQAGSERQSEPTSAPVLPRPQPRWRGIAVALAAVAIVVGIGWGLLNSREPSPIDLGEPINDVLEAVLPTPLRTYPKLNAPTAPETLQPGPIKAGDRNIRAIRQGRANGADWYQFDFENNMKRYVETQRLPAWTPLDPNTDLVRTVETRELPRADAKRAVPLPPDSLGLSRRQFGPPRTGALETVLWYRIRRSPTEDIYFSERDAAGKLATWAEYAGCLQTTRRVRARTAIFDGDDADPYSDNQRLLGPLQVADVDRRRWVRYRRPDGGFNYLSFGDLKPCS